MPSRWWRIPRGTPFRERPVATGGWLAEELGVSLRTLYRDVRDLEESGVPIEGEAGVGYRLARGYELPPMTFNAAEFEALVAGARMVQAGGDPKLGMAAAPALAKIREVLPEALQHLSEDASVYAPYGMPSQHVPEALGPLRRAIRQRRKQPDGGAGEGGPRAHRPAAVARPAPYRAERSAPSSQPSAPFERPRPDGYSAPARRISPGQVS